MYKYVYAYVLESMIRKNTGQGNDEVCRCTLGVSMHSTCVCMDDLIYVYTHDYTYVYSNILKSMIRKMTHEEEDEVCRCIINVCVCMIESVYVHVYTYVYSYI